MINVYSQNPDATLKSDFISLHCPLNDDTREMVNESLISEMKDGVILINTARGGLINEADMAAALKSGKVAAYATDVLSTEPPLPDHPLIGIPPILPGFQRKPENI